MGYPSHLRERLGKFIYNHVFRRDAEGSSMLLMLESLRERDFDDADAMRWKTDILGLLGGNVLQAFASLSSEERSNLKRAIWELFNWLGPDDVGPEGERR